MHGKVGLAAFQRRFQLLDEQPLAAHLRERAVKDAVALRRHPKQAHAVPKRLQTLLHMLRLPHGEAAFTGGDGQLHGGSKGKKCKNG